MFKSLLNMQASLAYALFMHKTVIALIIHV